MKTLFKTFLVATVLTLTVPLAAALKPADTELARAVPSDVLVLEHKVAIEEDDFAEEAWGRVMKAVLDSGIIKQSLELMLGELDDEQRAMVEEKIASVQELFNSVDWAALASQEQIFTMRFDPNHPLAQVTQGMAPPDYVFGFHGHNAEANYDALSDALEYVVDLGGENLVLTETDAGGIDRADLTVFGLQSFVLLRKDELIIFSVGNGLLQDVLAGLKGDLKGEALVETQDFKDAVALLPPAQTTVSYSRMGEIWDYTSGVMNRVFEVSETQKPEDAAEIRNVREFFNLMFEELSLLDTIVSTSRVEGYKMVDEVAVIYGENAEDTIIYRAFLQDRTIDEWAKYVPKEATGFSASSGVNLVVLYDEILNVVRKVGGDAVEAPLAQWEDMQAQYEVDVREDLLGWISGETISFKLPKVGMSDNGASLFKVNDEEKARQIVGRLLDTVNEMLKQNGQAQIGQMPAANLGDEFKVLTHPQMMMFGVKLIVGVQDGWLFLGLSEDAVSKSLATARGDHPSIRANEDFQRRSVEIGDKVTMIKYQDMSNMGQELAAGVAMGTFFGGMAANQPDAPPQIGKIFSLIGRLAGPLQQINFLDSTVSVGHAHTNYIRTTTVTAYKESVVAP